MLACTAAERGFRDARRRRRRIFDDAIKATPWTRVCKSFGVSVASWQRQVANSQSSAPRMCNCYAISNAHMSPNETQNISAKPVQEEKRRY
jgi:hypothetical protein